MGDGTVVGTGASFATYDAHGALTSMTGFIDEPASPDRRADRPVPPMTDDRRQERSAGLCRADLSCRAV